MNNTSPTRQRVNAVPKALVLNCLNSATRGFTCLRCGLVLEVPMPNFRRLVKYCERVRQLQAKAEEKLQQLLVRVGYREEATTACDQNNGEPRKVKAK